MSYDPMAALDMEKRLGIKNNDIDDFLRKANAVQDAIKGLKDGTLDPSKEIEIEGIETESQKQSKAEELAKKKEEYLAREAKKKAKLKEEEKQKWWRGAELFQGMSPDSVIDNDEEANEDQDTTSQTSAEELKKAATLQRYSNDYSRWELPVVDDPATLAEQEELAAAKEAKENAEFEKNNPDFCGEFRADQEKRAASAKEKAEGANVLRLKGNRFFKAKKYAEAIEKYMASLKVQPYAVNTLTNISIAYHKKCNYEDALEFASRSVYLEPYSIKARCRKATTLRSLGRLEEALEDANVALKITIANKEATKSKGTAGKAEVDAAKGAMSEHAEVCKLVGELQGEISDRDLEKTVEAEAKKAAIKDTEIEKKLKQQMEASNLPKSPASSSINGFKKVDIEMDSSDDETKDADNQTSSITKKSGSGSKSTKACPVLPRQSNALPSIDSLFASKDPLSDLELPSQYRIIDELISTLKDPSSNGITKSGIHALDVLSVLLRDSKEARVYLRTSQGLMFLCCRLCGGGLAMPTPVSSVIGARPDGEGFDLDDAEGESVTGRPLDHLDSDPARTMVAIAASLIDERRSKVLVRDQGVLKAAVELIGKTYQSNQKKASDENSLPAKLMMEAMADDSDSTLVSKLLDQNNEQDAIGVAALTLISACIEGVGGEAYAHFVASDVPTLSAILSTLPSSTFTSAMEGKIRQFSLAAAMFRDLCLIETCRESIFKHTTHPITSTLALTESFRFFPEAEDSKKKQEKKKQVELIKAPDPVAVMACALEYSQGNFKLPSEKCRVDLKDARESAAGALANLALHTAMRSRFSPALVPLLAVASSINTQNTSGRKKNKSTSASTTLSETPAASAFALAALMNALITENDMKMVLCENSGVSKLMQLLKCIGGSGYGVIRVRAAGLLGRLVSVSSTIEELRKESNLTVLATAISNNRSEYLENKEPWVLDERENLVRVVAAVVSGKGYQSSISVLHTANTFAMLVEFLPTARTDSSGKVTASSVVMPSQDRVSFKLSGNVVKCFVSVLDDPNGAPAQRLLKAGLLERLVGLLANTQELSVRKNVAVVLARAMKHPPAMERVRELRGMEMLVQLGPQL